MMQHKREEDNPIGVRLSDADLASIQAARQILQVPMGEWVRAVVGEYIRDRRNPQARGTGRGRARLSVRLPNAIVSEINTFRGPAPLRSWLRSVMIEAARAASGLEPVMVEEDLPEESTDELPEVETP